MWICKTLRLTDDEMLNKFDEIRTYEVMEVLRYRYGMVRNCSKQENIDLMNRKSSDYIFGAYRKLHNNLAGVKADNHQIIVCKNQGEEIVLRFSDYHIYMYYDAEIERRQF